MSDELNNETSTIEGNNSDVSVFEKFEFEK